MSQKQQQAQSQQQQEEISSIRFSELPVNIVLNYAFKYNLIDLSVLNMALQRANIQKQFNDDLSGTLPIGNGRTNGSRRNSSNHIAPELLIYIKSNPFETTKLLVELEVIFTHPSCHDQFQQLVQQCQINYQKTEISDKNVIPWFLYTVRNRENVLKLRPHGEEQMSHLY
ncbi:hypothetical protein MP228_001749 [Amoeboaphelidium protococcarum]|nr:hypothetical protein MP228_001749 [Amoeboaphelidium protococcarum]